jgi:excisionase family DNA binding protein
METTMPQAAATPDPLYDRDLAERRLQLGLLLRTMRRSTSRMSQGDLGRHLKLTQPHITQIERGQRSLSEAHLAVLDVILPAFAAARLALNRPPGTVATFPHAVDTPAVEPPLDALARLPDPMRVDELAHYLRCSKGTVYTLIRDRKLKSVRLGRLVRLRRCDVVAFLAGHGR